MLRGANAIAAFALVASVASVAVADSPRQIREPVRLTAGPSSELMGVTRGDGSALYFVSDADATLDLMVQAPIQSGPKAVSSGLGDIAWPELSPDEKHIAYISFERDSTGDVCFVPLDGKTGKAGKEKCLTGSDSAELQVLWWDSSSLAVLSRRDLHGDFVLRKLPIGGGKAQTLTSENMVGLALSPDRKWLAYIPLEKRAKGVGVTFSNRTAKGVRIQSLSGKTALTYTPNLPGVTGYLAFAKDGKHLYFSQYLNDTNRDGQIDGDDHGVTFRTPFDPEKWKRKKAKPDPEQLTSALWNCHYPAPSTDQLIVSCSHDGSLDIYSLPLEGAVPNDWTAKRLVGEASFARDLWTKLLLNARRLSLSKAGKERDGILREVMSLHLELREYESAIFYAEGRKKTKAVLSWEAVIADLARHRRADLALIRGQLSQAYVQTERDRAGKLKLGMAKASVDVRFLATLVVSEVEDDIGEKAEALATFQALDLTAITHPLVARLAAERALDLYRLRGDRTALLGVYQTLSGLAPIDVGERLRYAQSFVDELSRGRNRKQRADAIAEWRPKQDEASDLALLLDVEKALLALGDDTQDEVRAEIFALYRKNKNLDRRRALVLATLQSSAKLGNEFMQYQFATSWASWLKRAHPERKYAETIYNNIMLDRAYGEGAQGEIGESRGYFYGTTVSTNSLEAHIGFIEARIEEGADSKVASLDDVYKQRFKQEPDSPVYAFIKAYRIARELPRELDLKRHEEDVAKVIELLADVAARQPRESQVHQLWGFVLHQRARRSASREAAVSANRQYLLALDLARGDDRLTASLLHRLGLLQASLGNHRLALRYFLKRDRLPHVRPLAELGLRVATARSAWHAGEALIAKTQMTAAAEILEKRPSLKKYEPLVLDRLAMSLSAAGDAAEARRRYNELADLQDKGRDATAINRLKASVGLAVASIESGEPQVAIKALSKAETILDGEAPLENEPEVVWRESLTDDYRYTRLQYRVLVTGLLVAAHRGAGNTKAARAAIGDRIDLIEERLKKSRADEDRYELAHAYQQLGELAYREGDNSAARVAIERGLELSAEWNKNTGSGVNDAGLALIAGYAELHLYGGVTLSTYKRDLSEELSRAYTFICKYRSPRWSKQRFLFETYLTMLAVAP